LAELRLALADDARAPRIIQTISKRGYRLIATVEHTGVCHASVGHALAPSGSSQPPTHHPTDGAPWSDQISEFGPRTRSLFSTTLELVARWRRHAAQPAE
jgi:DNA-binding winged helix-turn-helix (wHTH) protein